MVTNIVYARRVFLWGLAIFAFGFGVPLAFYGLAGGGEMGVEGVAMLGLLPLILLGFWVGVPVMLIGLIAWVILKIRARKKTEVELALLVLPPRLVGGESKNPHHHDHQE